MNIYELPDRYKEMLALLDECDDESMQEAVDNAIAELKGDLASHAENLGKSMASLQASNAAIKCETERLKKLADSRTKAYDAIKNGLRKAMIETDTQKINTELFTFSLRKGSQSVEIVDESKIPDEYMKVEVITKPIKNDIKAAIASGLITEDAARIVTGDRTLTMK